MRTTHKVSYTVTNHEFGITQKCGFQIVFGKGNSKYGNNTMMVCKYEDGNRDLYDIRYDTEYSEDDQVGYIKKFINKKFGNGYTLTDLVIE